MESSWAIDTAIDSQAKTLASVTSPPRVTVQLRLLRGSLECSVHQELTVEKNGVKDPVTLDLRPREGQVIEAGFSSEPDVVERGFFHIQVTVTVTRTETKPRELLRKIIFKKRVPASLRVEEEAAAIKFRDQIIASQPPPPPHPIHTHPVQNEAESDGSGPSSLSSTSPVQTPSPIQGKLSILPSIKYNLKHFILIAYEFIFCLD